MEEGIRGRATGAVVAEGAVRPGPSGTRWARDVESERERLAPTSSFSLPDFPPMSWNK